MYETFSGTSRTAPRWAGDFRGRESLVPAGARLDPTQFNALDAVRVQLAAAADIADVQLAVDALSGPIPAGTILDFGGDSFARVPNEVAAGAVIIPVAALGVAIADDAAAWYRGIGLINIPSGTFIGRTLAERALGTPYGAWAPGDDDAWLTAFDVTDARKKPDCELYRHQMVVKENRLPGWATKGDPEKAAIRGLYTCILGAS